MVDRLVDHYDSECDQRVDRAVGKAGHHLLQQ